MIFYKTKSQRKRAAMLHVRGVCRSSDCGVIQSPNENRLQFLLRYPCLLLLILVGSGCSMVSGTRKPDGTLVVTSWRALWKSEAVNFSVADTNFTATLGIGKSGSDEESIRVAVDAAVRAAMKFVVPIP